MNRPSPTVTPTMRRLVLAAALLALATGSAPAHADVDTAYFDRIRAARAALPVDPPAAWTPGSLARRAPLTSLDVLVVGCDFADSLMYGRDLDDFPGWPAQRRTSQVVPDGPGVGTPIFAAHDSTYFDLQMQRVDDYFRTVSFGRFDLRWDVHGTIVNLPEGMGYYGDDDSSSVRSVRMARQVIDAIDDEVDFSNYDTVLLIHAGAGQETDIDGDSPAQIFSNYLDVRDFQRAVDAEVLDEPFLATGEAPVEHVLVLPESLAQDPPTGVALGGFFDVRGVFAFELGLRMGMLSLADFTPGNFPDSQGIGNFGLMGYGLFTGLGTVPAAPCAMNRYLMGWVDAVDVTSTASVRIGAMNAVGDAVSDTLLVRVPITDREYWLLEYRLQDPNGDLFYSFPGKEAEGGGNGNNLPDYFDADSTVGDGTPTSTFDPTVDTWEDELGAEWDWFMSENGARTADGCQRAGGSGLYVWHVDERVIQDAILAGTNTINGDATRKGVDVEEADGLQDLDSLAGGVYLLGSDDDAWRGEGNTEFGPTTRPSTASNDGFDTGIRIFGMSEVVQDSLPKFEFPDGSGNFFCSGFVYAPAMTFEVEFGVDASGPREIGRVRMDGFAPVADLRAVDFFGPGGSAADDGAIEIVAVADSGRVLVWQDGVEPWNGTDAVFHRAAGEEFVGAPSFLEAFGLVIATTGDVGVTQLLPSGPVVLDDQAAAFDGPPLSGAVGSGTGDVLAFRWVRASDDAFVVEELRPGSSQVLRTTAPIDATFDAALLHTTLSGFAVGVQSDSTATSIVVFDRQGQVHRRVPVQGGVIGSTLTPLGLGIPLLDPVVAWVGDDGRVHTTALQPDDTDLDRTSIDGGLPASGLATARATAAGASVLALSAGDALHVLDANLRQLPGFPYRVARGGVDDVVGTRAVPPVLVDLDGDGRVEVIWHEPAGTVHAVDLQGRALDGWPIAGPSEPISSPVVADLDGDGDLDLAVAGRFENVVSVDSPARDFERRVRGEIRVYDLEVPVGAYAPWTQFGGDTARRVLDGQVVRAGSVGADPGLVVYPNPSIDGTVRVRFRVPRDGAFRLAIYTLEGQEVLVTDPVAVEAGTFFEEEIHLVDVASGMYLCRVSGDGVDERGVLTVVR